MAKKKLKRTNSISLNDYKTRIKNYDKNGRLYMAYSTYQLYRIAGGVSSLSSMVSFEGENGTYYKRQLKLSGWKK